MECCLKCTVHKLAMRGGLVMYCTPSILFAVAVATNNIILTVMILFVNLNYLIAMHI